MATLTYSQFGNPGRSYLRARYTIVDKAWRELSFFLIECLIVLIMRASAYQAAAARCGWRPPTSRGGFFQFMDWKVDSISTCMQIFMKIDRKYNRTLFI